MDNSWFQASLKQVANVADIDELQPFLGNWCRFNTHASSVTRPLLLSRGLCRDLFSTVGKMSAKQLQAISSPQRRELFFRCVCLLLSDTSIHSDSSRLGAVSKKPADLECLSVWTNFVNCVWHTAERNAKARTDEIARLKMQLKSKKHASKPKPEDIVAAEQAIHSGENSFCASPITVTENFLSQPIFAQHIVQRQTPANISLTEVWAAQ